MIDLQWAYFPHIHFGLMPDHQGGGLKKNNNNIRHKVKVVKLNLFLLISAEFNTLL